MEINEAHCRGSFHGNYKSGAIENPRHSSLRIPNASTKVFRIPRRNPVFPAVTLTLKNVSPQLQRVLKIQARQHKRSLNQEAILCLEKAVGLSATRPSLTAPPPPTSVGSLLHPTGSRSEMLDDFLERGA